MRYLSILLFSCFLCVSVVAQEKKEYDWKTNLKVADDLYRRNSFYNAADFYEKVLKVKPDNTEALYKLAESQRLYRDYYNAAANYKKLLDTEATKYTTARFYYALMLKQTGKYEEAIIQFDQYSASDNKDDKLVQRAQIEKQGCAFSKTLTLNTDVKVKHLDNKVNSMGTDFAPFALTKDQLVFSSIRTDTAIVIWDTVNFFNAAALSRIYVMKQDGDTWAEPRLLPEFINGNMNAANGTFSPDRTAFFYTECTYDKMLNVHCDLYICRYKGGVWDQPTKLPAQINSPGSSNTHPAVMINNETDKNALYFSSDRAGGKGGKDIWYAAFDDNFAFSEPVNAGDIINTAEDEVTPFFDADQNMLYFSSNGKVGLGGFDVFRTALDGKGSVAENLGLPYNSFADDLYYSLFTDRQTGYVASNRPGSRSLRSESTSEDIFTFKVRKGVDYKGFAYQTGDTNQVPLAGVKVTVYVKDPKTNKYEPTTDYMATTGADNKFSVSLKGNLDYKLVATKDKYLTDTRYVTAAEIEAAQGPQNMVFSLEKINKDKTYTLKNIYYDYKSATLRDSSKVVLDTLFTLLENNPRIVIELSSHTDSRGGNDYNQQLSQERAESCVNYLISKGITANRMIPKGYGETKLLNNCGDKSKCTEEQHQVNRRTEFKVVGETEEGTIIK
jgi:OOP family OmpA-OmpF porin